MTDLEKIAVLRAALDAVEDALDDQIYPEEVRDDFDAPDDREYSVTITAALWRKIGRALSETSKPALA